MRKILSFRFICLSLLAILLIMQLFRIDKTNPAPNSQADFISIAQPPEEIARLIKTGCYDCHSNESVYPWYSNIAPFSWIIKSHIDDARKDVNFSEWGNYQPGKRGHKLDECKEMIEKGEMPLAGYELLHPRAKFSSEEREKLKSYLTVK